MTRTASAVISLTVAAIAGSPALAGAAGKQPLHRITGASALPARCSAPGSLYRGAEVEPTLAVDPGHARQLVVAWIDQGNNVTASSSDGGRHWRTGLVPAVSRCTGGVFQSASDPWLSIGPEGTTYLASESDNGPSATAILINRSRDSGRTWTFPVYVDHRDVPLAYDDKEAVTADPHRPGVAYVVWAQNRDVSRLSERDLYLARTTNRGRVWSTPQRIYEAQLGTRVRASEVIVTGPRRLVCVFSIDDAAPDGLAAVGGAVTFLALTSRDGGRSWSGLSRIATTHNLALTDFERGTDIRASAPLFSADADRRGRAYVAWRDARSSHSSPILLSTSSDGRRWSGPTLVSPGANRGLIPDLAVAHDGTVAVRFYDLRDDRPGDTALTANSWLRYSFDRGRHWGEKRLGGSFDLRNAPLVNGRPLATGLFIGDYEGLVAVPGGFATVFARAQPTAGSGATDLFFARIKVQRRQSHTGLGRPWLATASVGPDARASAHPLAGRQTPPRPARGRQRALREPLGHEAADHGPRSR